MGAPVGWCWSPGAPGEGCACHVCAARWHPGPSTWGAAPAASPRSSNSPRREVAPGTPCAGGAVSTRALRLRQARPGGAVLWLGGGLCCGSVPPVCVGCVAGAVCRASARVRGRLGAVTVQRWLRGEGWHWGGRHVKAPHPPRGGCRRTVGRSVCSSVRRGEPAPAVDAPLPLAVVRGDGKGTRKSMALFCSPGDGWAPGCAKRMKLLEPNKERGCAGGCPVLGGTVLSPHRGHSALLCFSPLAPPVWGAEPGSVPDALQASPAPWE